MNGGKISGFFGSMFGELFLDRDCANILQDPNADPMDRDICQTFKEFSAGFPSIDSIVDREPEEGTPDHDETPDAQSLRDSIFNKQASPRQPERSFRHQPKGDEDLDSQLAEGADPNTLLDPPSQSTHEGFSSYTKVTVTRRPDGTVEERRTHRDSLGNEQETTIIRDGGEPSSERPSIRSRLSDWVWPKH